MDAADALLSQSVLKPGFQKNYKVPVNDNSSRAIKRNKKVRVCVAYFPYVPRFVDDGRGPMFQVETVLEQFVQIV